MKKTLLATLLSRLGVVIMLLLFSDISVAEDVNIGAGICYQIEKAINALADATQTSCFPSAGRKTGTLSFIIISAKPVFSVEHQKKGWLLVAVAAAGSILNKNPSVKVDELWLSDGNMTKNLITHTLPANVAKSLHRQIYADKINLEAMYSGISKNMAQKIIAKK